MPGVAYNPYDPAQQKLLGALSLSEVGGAKNPLNLGTGGHNLTGAPLDTYGFPQWSGEGNSHAAGYFQFQPGTWASYAKAYDLDFQDAQDQKAGAWYLAQDTYRKETGKELSAAIQAGDYASIESALGKTQWIGARGKLASYLGGGQGRDLGGSGQNPVSEDTSGPPTLGDFLRNPVKAVGDVVSRYLVFIVGALILIAAVWWLLSDAGVVPSAGTVAKTAVKVAAVAA